MSVRRIVVAMDMPGAIAVTTAVELARTLEAELLGLFVEDVQLFDLAALPFAGEVGFPSATCRVLTCSAPPVPIWPRYSSLPLTTLKPRSRRRQ